MTHSAVVILYNHVENRIQKGRWEMDSYQGSIWGFSENTMAINPIYIGGTKYCDNWEDAINETKEAVTYFENHGYNVTNVEINKVNK